MLATLRYKATQDVQHLAKQHARCVVPFAARVLQLVK